VNCPNCGKNGRVHSLGIFLGENDMEERFECMKCHTSFTDTAPPQVSKRPLKRGKYNPDEIDIIRKLHNTHTSQQIARKLNRKPDSVRGKTHDLNLKPKITTHPYSKEEMEYIREHYSTTNITEIMEKLGRTRQSINSKANSMGVKRPVKPSTHQPIPPLVATVAKMKKIFQEWGISEEDFAIARAVAMFEPELRKRHRIIDETGKPYPSRYTAKYPIPREIVINGHAFTTLRRAGVMKKGHVNIPVMEHYLNLPCNKGIYAPWDDQ